MSVLSDAVDFVAVGIGGVVMVEEVGISWIPGVGKLRTPAAETAVEHGVAGDNGVGNTGSRRGAEEVE